MQIAEMRLQTVQSNAQFRAASILILRCTSFFVVVVVVIVFKVMMYTVVLHVFVARLL